MVMTFLTKGRSGSVVLYFLQSGYLFRGTASQKRIAVFNFSCSGGGAGANNEEEEEEEKKCDDDDN